MTACSEEGGPICNTDTCFRWPTPHFPAHNGGGSNGSVFVLRFRKDVMAFQRHTRGPVTLGSALALLGRALRRPCVRARQIRRSRGSPAMSQYIRATNIHLCPVGTCAHWMHVFTCLWTRPSNTAKGRPRGGQKSKASLASKVAARSCIRLHERTHRAPDRHAQSIKQDERLLGLAASRQPCNASGAVTRRLAERSCCRAGHGSAHSGRCIP